MAVTYGAFEEDVASRFLLDKQAKVGRHQVNAPLNAQFFADKCWLKHGL